MTTTMFELISGSLFNPGSESIEEIMLVFSHALLTCLLGLGLFVYSLLEIAMFSRGVKQAIVMGHTLLVQETEKHNTKPVEVEERAIDRADRQPSVKPYNYWNTSSKPTPFQAFAAVSSVDDGSSRYESTFGSTSGYGFSDANYSGNSYKAQIAVSGPSNATAADRKVNLVRANFKGEACVADKGNDVRVEQGPVPGVYDNNGPDRLYDYYNQKSEAKPPEFNKTHLDSQNSTPGKIQSSGMSTDHAAIANDSLKTRKDDKVTSANKGYNKLTYTVLIGNTVKVYNTTMASNPHYDKFIVKERYKDTSGITKTKLTLKSNGSARDRRENDHKQTLGDDDDNEEKDGSCNFSKKLYFRENYKKPGFIIYTCDSRFRGTIKYPLPNGKATDTKIGKGGNGFVFVIYHELKQYAVKKTVYRPNEVNVHAALKHENILPLLAVLMGERHERHSGKFYCFHFMPKMDYDLRQILSTKEIGCLKNLYYRYSKSKELDKWTTAYKNIKYILKETLKALAYLHMNGYVHRDVKASNIMVKMSCRCRPLSCNCKSNFQVKLGDFDSAGTVPGLGITEPTDQIIKFASILPLGTPGYRAPEVSMHITLSGPYETLYTTAVDMWSVGCLCLNICIGKTAALKQREEASLLLSLTHTRSQELWEKTTKIKELEQTNPFSHDSPLLKFVSACLQVKSSKRPSAQDGIQALSGDDKQEKINPLWIKKT